MPRYGPSMGAEVYAKESALEYTPSSSGRGASRTIGPRAVNGAAVQEHHGARTSGRRVDHVVAHPPDVLLATGHRVVAVVVVLGVQVAVVGAAHHRERSPVRAATLDVDPDRDRAVVGVGPRRDVLVPLEPAAAPAGLEVELGVVELDVRSDHVGRQRGHVVTRDELPERGVMRLGAHQPVQPGRLGAVPFLEDVGVVLGDLPAALDDLFGRGAQPCDPVRGNRTVHGDIAVGEVEAALRSLRRIEGWASNVLRDAWLTSPRL